MRMSTMGWSVNPATIALSLVTVCLFIVKASRKQEEEEIVSRTERALLPTEPVHKRRLELGHSEFEYVRLHLEQQGGHRIFFVARATCRAGFRVSLQDLERAGRVLQRKHPLLRCRFVRTKSGKLVLEEDVHLPLQYFVRDRSLKSFKEYFTSECELRPATVGPEADSPHAIWLFQGGEDDPQVEIALDLAHFAADGSGLHPMMDCFLHECFSTPNGDAADNEYGAWPIPQDVALDLTIKNKLGLNQIWRVFYLLKAIYKPVSIALCRKFHVWPTQQQERKGNDYVGNNHTVCAFWCLDERESEMLVSKCRENKTSVTCAISACLNEACAELIHMDEPFYTMTFLLGDSRGLCEPKVSSVDGSPHAFPFPCFQSETRRWTPECGTVQDRWNFARSLKAHLNSIMVDPYQAIPTARLIPFALGRQPVDTALPLCSVSSWGPKGQVKHEYGGGTATITHVELLQNMAFHSWVNTSIYTMLNRISVSLFVPTPRYEESKINEASKRTLAKLRELIQA